MSARVRAVEGVVVDGSIRLPAGVRLPERARVYVIITDDAAVPKAHVASPRLAHPEQAPDFAMHVSEGARDAGLR